MYEIILDVFLDSFNDVLKMIPIMFLVILLSDIIVNKLKKVKTYDSVYGIFTGAVLGVIPQCGVPVSFAELFSKSLIGLSILITVFLSSSDEAIIVASGHYNINFIIKLILSKVIIAILFGLALYFLLKKDTKKSLIRYEVEITCEENFNLKSIFLKSLKSTINISIYVLITVFIINLVIENVGLENLHQFLKDSNFFQPVITSFIGLIPSCASSIFLIEAHMNKIISYGALISGLCANSGYGILIIFKTKPLKEALKITSILIFISIISGEIIQFLFK